MPADPGDVIDDTTFVLRLHDMDSGDCPLDFAPYVEADRPDCDGTLGRIDRRAIATPVESVWLDIDNRAVALTVAHMTE